MAHYSGGEDASLLETMLMPFLSSYEDTSEPETDLKKYLATQSDEFLTDNDLKVSETDTDDYPLEVLFTRASPLPSGQNDQQSLKSFQRSTSINEENNVPGSEENGSIKKCNFLQTRNRNYRTFMEEVMLIKCCSMKILECLEDTKLLLEQYIEIKDDPGFGRVHITQAWVWILKEAIVSASLKVGNEKRRKKVFASIFTQMLSNMERCFKQLLVDTKNAKKTFDNVYREFEMLAGQAYTRFSNNIESSLDYEIKSSGYNFFFHRKDSTDSLAESTGERLIEKTKNTNKAEDDENLQQSLQVRCSIDGVTLRTGKLESSWLKFQKIDQDRDIQLLLNIFMNKMTELCTNVRKNISLVNELLEVHKSSSSKKIGFNDSILKSIQKCQEILSTPRTEAAFFPKEAVIMLYSLKTTKAAFELIIPLLTEFALSTDRQFTIVREFSKQQKLAKKGIVANRFPLDLNARFELLVEDTKVNTDIILNRYPNIRDAKQLKEKLLQKYSAAGSFSEPDTFVTELPTDIIYKCPSQVFFAQSTQEIIEMFRKLIFTQNIINPNPAHYLFTDIEQEYISLTKELTTSRTITPEMVSLCSDPFQNLHQAAMELSSFKDKLLTQIVYATQKLTHTESGIVVGKKDFTPMSSWIQAICKIVHVWNFHKLNKPLQTHFRAKNLATMRWIAKLEETFRELTLLVKNYKEEFYQFHDFIELNHGFITWIRKIFMFNPPNEILEKWGEETKDGDTNDNNLTVPHTEDIPRFQLNFHDFDMSVQQINPPDESSSTLVTLNKCSGNVQLGIVTTFFNYIDQIVSSSITNLNSARAILEKYINLKSLKKAISPDKKLACVKHINQLEDLVLALTFEMTLKDLKETISYVGFLNRTISQFNRMFQTVQLHLENRGMLDDNVGSRTDSIRRRKSKKTLYSVTDHRSHDKYLNESVQLLMSSVEAMPNIFDIQVEELANSLVSWAKLSYKDDELTAKMDPLDNHSVSDNDKVEGRETDESNTNWPINFEEAMTLTTTGKTFFPDPQQFSLDIECWRTICFKMLAAALDKFREMTTTKIIDTKTVLSSPQVSQTSMHEQQSAVPKVSSIGYTEGLCSVLCFMTEKLVSRDLLIVSSSDLKFLKEKFTETGAAVDKFKKGLDAAEKVLVNSLSLSMASVEHKRLPQYLPVLPLEDDFLKSHDLEEVGSMLSLSVKKDAHDESSVTNIKDSETDVPALTNELVMNTENIVEIHWDSSNKKKLFCKSSGSGGDSAWLQCSQLHITGQLRLIHLIICELTNEFVKAAELVKEAKADLICAKRLLEKTWKGIGNDMKKKIIPGSGIVVLLKLYRHQVATAVVNLKAIRKITGEVKYLLSQSAQNVKIWMNEKSRRSFPGRLDNNNYILNLDNLSLTVRLKPPAPGNTWLRIDEEKVAKEEKEADASSNDTKSQSKIIMEIMEAVQVKSSVSVINPKNATDLQLYQAIDSSLSGGDGETNVSKLTRKKLRDGNLEKINNFLVVAPSIEQLIISELAQTAILLKLPNCCTSREDVREVTNMMGILTALVAVTMDIRFFREVLQQDRDFILRRISSLQENINRIRSNGTGVVNAINTESKKIKKHVESLDASIRSKFSFEGEYPPMEEILTAPHQPTCRITPMEFVEGIAASIQGHVWTVECGAPAVGTVIKNNKTLESHAMPNIPLISKLEVLISIVSYFEKMMSHVHSNLECSKKNIGTAKSLVKSKGNEITARNNIRRLLGVRWRSEDITMSKSEVKDHLTSFARISNACTKAQEQLDQILTMLQQAKDILEQVSLYISLKFRLEPSVGSPNIDNDALLRAQNWQSVDIITGVASPPNVPPPVILKKIAKKTRRQENAQIMYKGAWEHKILELEVHFDQLCKRQRIAVDIPIVFAPASTIDDEVDD